MSLLDDLKKNVTDFSESVARKSSEIIENQKLKMQRSSLEGDLRDCYVALGRLYEKRLSGGTEKDTEEEKLLEKLNHVKTRMTEIEEQLRQLKGVVQCPGCGQSVSQNFEFCPQCGARISGQSASGSGAEPQAENDGGTAPQPENDGGTAPQPEEDAGAESQPEHQECGTGEDAAACDDFKKEEKHDEE